MSGKNKITEGWNETSLIKVKKSSEEYPEMPFPDDALETENWYEVSETFQDMKLKYGKNMSDFIRGTELDEGETIEDIEIEKE